MTSNRIWHDKVELETQFLQICHTPDLSLPTNYPHPSDRNITETELQIRQRLTFGSSVIGRVMPLRWPVIRRIHRDVATLWLSSSLAYSSSNVTVHTGVASPLVAAMAPDGVEES